MEDGKRRTRREEAADDAGDTAHAAVAEGWGDDASLDETTPEDEMLPDDADRERRLAYLEGLAEGLEEAESPPTVNLLTGIVDLLGELSDEVRTLRRAQRELASDFEDLAEELTAEPEDLVVTCPGCGSEVAFAAHLLDEDEIELTCPSCGEIVYTPGEDELVEETTAAEPGVRGARHTTPRSRGEGTEDARTADPDAMRTEGAADARERDD